MAKSKQKKSKYDTAFFIRIGILVPLLLLVAGGMAYDRMVLVPRGEEKVAEILEIQNPGDGTAEAVIEEAAGQAAAETKTVGNYVVKEYRFGRILPNLAPHICTIVFSDGQLVESYAGTMPAADFAVLEQNPTLSSESTPETIDQ